MDKFCVQCGTKMDKDAKFCAQCGSQIDVTLSQLDSGTPKSINENSEVVLHKGLANWCKSALNVQNGQGVLTNKRFIYSRHNLAKTVALGLLVNLTDGKYEFDIPYSSIKDISQGRHGLGKTLTIETKDGSIYKFAVMSYNKWAEIIIKHLA